MQHIRQPLRTRISGRSLFISWPQTTLIQKGKGNPGLYDGCRSAKGSMHRKMGNFPPYWNFFRQPFFYSQGRTRSHGTDRSLKAINKLLIFCLHWYSSGLPAAWAVWANWSAKSFLQATLVVQKMLSCLYYRCWQASKETSISYLHCKKRLSIFLSPAVMSLTKLSLAMNN